MGHLNDPGTGTDSNALDMATQMQKSGLGLMGVPGAPTFVGIDLMHVPTLPGAPGAATEAQESEAE